MNMKYVYMDDVYVQYMYVQYMGDVYMKVDDMVATQPASGND